MAANIGMTNGKASMMYTGEAPWHGLGTRLDNPATSEEAIIAAGLDWTVDLIPLQTIDGEAVHDRKLVRRTDTRTHFGCVGNDWVPIQNRQAFAFLDAIAADGGIEYHTAGALGNGDTIWLLAKLPGVLRVGRTDDITEKFLLFANWHRRGMAARGFWTPIRVVCQNTLSAAMTGQENKGITIRHVGDIQTRIAEAQRILGLAVRYYDDIQPVVDALARHRPGTKQLAAYFAELYPDPVDPEKSPRAASTAKANRETLFGLFEHGIGQDMPGIKGTSWAAYNAVTEFVDHRRKIQAGGTIPLKSELGASRHLESVWFGDGHALKQTAWDGALAMAGVK